MQIIVSAPIYKGQTELVNGYKIEIVDAPALVGTEKQVAWAEDIRKGAIEDFVHAGLRARKADGRRLIDAAFRTEAWEAAIAEANEVLKEYAAKLATITDAKAWIEAAGGSKSILTIRALLK